MTKYDFALQWVDYQQLEIYNKGKRVLEYQGDPEFEITPMTCRIRIGEDIGEDVKEVQMFWPELDEMGYGIINDSYYKGWKPFARGCHKIVRKGKAHCMSYDAFRQACTRDNMRIMHYPSIRAFRLIGENVLKDKRTPAKDGIGELTYYSGKGKGGRKSKKKLSYNQKMSILLGEISEETEEFIHIKDVPVLITDDKKIVCIKEEAVPHRIIVVGKSRYGKSEFTSSVATSLFYQHQASVGWICDPMNQFHSFSAPSEYEPFNRINDWIYNEVKPIPAIQMYMAHKKMLNHMHSSISFTLSLNFFEFLNKYGYYTFGNKELEIPGSITYLKERAKTLKDCKDFDEFKKAIMSTIPVDNKGNIDKNSKAMANKWLSKFDKIFKAKFTSNLYQDDMRATDELEVRFKDGKVIKTHPFIAAMEAGLIPVINAFGCQKESWFRNYLADLMQKIIDYQGRLERGKRNKTYIIADELGVIYEKGMRMDNVSRMSEEIFRQGAFNDIGFVGNTQSLSKLNPEVYKNATHIATVLLQGPDDRKLIRKIFDLNKEFESHQNSLKKGEIMIFSQEPFVIYDRDKRFIDDKKKWYKGKIIPPINHHEMPKK